MTIKPLREFTVERLIRGREGVDEKVSRIFVNAVNAADAGKAADEIKYAAEWERGVYPDDQHKSPPADWAFNSAHVNGLV